MKLRKALLTLGFASVILTASCSSGEPLEMTLTFNHTPNDAVKVVEMIDAITTVDFSTENAIEDAYLEYCKLDDSLKNQVTNYEKLQEYRAAVTKLYYTEAKQGPRMDRSKVNIGTYCFNSQCWTDEGVQALVDCGIDFLSNASYNNTLLDLLEKYNVGAFASGVVPYWGCGGIDNGLVGMMSVYNPISAYESAAAAYVDRECIWGIDLGDEPWVADFPHYGEVIDYLLEAFPEQVMYLNLLPTFNDKNGNSNALETYVEHINTDYICYDNYPYTNESGKRPDNPRRFAGWLTNIQHASTICRESDKDLWIVIQANVEGDTPLKEENMRMQSSASLAYGARTISWGCWNAGWFNHNVADSQGNLTGTYYKLQTVNKEIQILSPVYSKYANIDAGYIGIDPNSFQGWVSLELPRLKELDISEVNGCPVTNIETSESSQLIVGCFEKIQGEGYAMMFVNMTDMNCDSNPVSNVYFTVENPEARVIAYYNGVAYEPEYLGNGQYKLEAGNSDNVFVTIG